MIPLMKNAFLNEKETKTALADFILNSNRLSMDVECGKFEKEFASFQGAKEAVLFNSGGSANLAMLQALKNTGKLKDGNKIGFSALTWSTNIMPIIQLGMQPVAIDCEPTTLNVMSHNLVDRLKDTEIQALFITNALGFSGDLNNIRNICNDNNILLIEDNCEALGTELKEGKTGSFGIMSSFSFFVAHHMSTIEGGMVCTNDEELAQMLKIVRANGWDRNLNALEQHEWRQKYAIKSEFEAKYTFYDLGYNIRPTEITGFLGRYQLKFLKDNILIREKNYIQLEKIAQKNDELLSIERNHISVISNFAFPIMCNNWKLKDKYAKQFSGAGIEIRPMIAGNIQKQPFYKKYIDVTYNLPGTDKIHDCGFYCGNYPELNDKDLQTISSCLIKYIE